MRTVFWDDGTAWDDVNFGWGEPSFVLEAGDPGYVAPVSQPATPTKPRRKKDTMNTDYIPNSYANLNTWLTLQQTALTTTLATTINMSAAERTAYLAAVGVLQPVLAAIVSLMDQLDQKTADLQPLLEGQLPVIRAAIKRAKTSPTCLPSIQEQLDWVGAAHNVDPSNAQPTITATAERGRVRIDGRKPGFEAVNIYFRKKGDVQWKLIAVRKRKFPFFDEAPLAVAGTPEVREYMAIGVVDDEEIGQTSEIREVVYAG